MTRGIYYFLLLTLIITFSAFVSFAQKKKQNVDTSAYKGAIPWEPIKAKDILWKKRVWREIEVYEKNNRAFRDNAGTPAENLFANVLVSGIRAGIFKAYRDKDTVFASPLTIDEVNAIIQCDPGELSWRARLYINNRNNHRDDKTDALSGTITSYDTAEVQSCIFPQQVERYAIMEDWIFDRNKGVMVVRIAAIAPMALVEGKLQKLFWVNYPDIREYIAKYEVYSGKDAKYRYTWDEYFESRQFSSKIVAVSGPDYWDKSRGYYIYSDPIGSDTTHHKSKKRDKRHNKKKVYFDKEIDRWVY